MTFFRIVTRSLDPESSSLEELHVLRIPAFAGMTTFYEPIMFDIAKFLSVL